MSDRRRDAETRVENVGNDAREREAAVRADVDDRRGDGENRADERRTDVAERLDGQRDQQVDARSDGQAAAQGDGASAFSDRVGEFGLNREAVVERQKERYGGIEWGSAFFGWLTATGTALLLTAIVAVVGAVAGSKYNVLDTLNSFPRIPVNEGSLTTGGVLALVVAALVSLAGAVLGGLAGMRFHRNVDRAGLTV